MYDTKPRKVDANTAQIVCNLAELAVRELEKKWALQVSVSEDTASARFCAVRVSMPSGMHAQWSLSSPGWVMGI